MRISDVANVTGIPITTLKDLRHRSILEMAVAGMNDDPDEIRRWGNFDASSVMTIKGASEVRQAYGMSWDDAVQFAKTALRKINITSKGQTVSACFLDLRAVPEEIWVGRFDFGAPDPIMPKDWNYFFGAVTAIPAQLEKMLHRRDATYAAHAARNRHQPLPEMVEPGFCLMLNASRLCRAFWEKAEEVGALRKWEDR